MLTKIILNVLIGSRNRRLTEMVMADLDVINREDAKDKICTMQSETV